MQKIYMLLFAVLMSVGLRAQGDLPFTYKLLATSNPQGQSNVQFLCNLPTGATDFVWSFGQSGGSSTLREPQFSYDVSVQKTFTVTLGYNYDGQVRSFGQEINANPAYFWVGPDPNFLELASLKRVFRSAFRYSVNHADSIGDMRYYWEIDGVRPSGNAFPANDKGDFPNIYRTFANGGAHTITLKVFNVNAPLINFAEHTLALNLQPDFSAGRQNFVNLPQFFTPNGDNLNDFFEVATSGTTPLSFMVFTRTGALVFQQSSNIIRWDGTTTNGRELPEGIYYFTLEDQGNLYNPTKGFFYIFRGKK